MSTDVFALLLLGYCALWGLLAALLHRTRPRISVTRHYAANGSTTTTAKELS